MLTNKVVEETPLSEDRLDNQEIDRFIELLQKWKEDDLNWGECCELREMKYRFSDTIEKYYWSWNCSS